MNSPRIALSLLEIVISMSLFGVVMVAVLQSMVSTTSYVDFDTARSDMTNAAMECQKRVIDDFANTAWFFAWDKDADRPKTDEKTNAREPLYPSVTDGGKRIEFLRLRSSLTANADPDKERYAYVNFRGDSSQPIEFSRYVDSSPTPLMVMNPNYIADPQLFVAPVWEAAKTNLDFDENQDPTKLRHYLYMVEPNATGTQCLVRKYHNGDGKWVLDSTVVDGVAGVHFATWIEDTTLNENQVRIMVLLSREQSGTSATGGKVQRRVEIIASMRSINQDS